MKMKVEIDSAKLSHNAFGKWSQLVSKYLHTQLSILLPNWKDQKKTESNSWPPQKYCLKADYIFVGRGRGRGGWQSFIPQHNIAGSVVGLLYLRNFPQDISKSCLVLHTQNEQIRTKLPYSKSITSLCSFKFKPYYNAIVVQTYASRNYMNYMHLTWWRRGTHEYNQFQYLHLGEKKQHI